MNLDPPESTLFPYTTLFRSQWHIGAPIAQRRQAQLDDIEAQIEIFAKAAFGHFLLNVIQLRLPARSEEHTSELQSQLHLVCRPLLEKKKCSLDGHCPEASVV